jgi:hypothetical protein
MLGALEHREWESDDQGEGSQTRPSALRRSDRAHRVEIDVTDAARERLRSPGRRTRAGSLLREPEQGEREVEQRLKDSSAEYAIIAARWVPRSAKNLLMMARTAPKYARSH